METNQLRAFLKVVELRSFTKAAEALYFSQPAVTQQIQALEREVGERLFERQGRRVTLTPAGEAFYPYGITPPRARYSTGQTMTWWRPTGR